MDMTESLLRAVLATVARGVFPPEELAKIIQPPGSNKKQLAAYNMCDGKTPQAAIGKKLKIDTGNLSRSIGRWIESGVVVKVGPDQFPLHLYPLNKT